MKHEIIFQVRIDRESDNFELIKKGLSNFEQAAFENFLQSYINYQKDISKEEIGEDYFENYDEEES